MKKFGKKILLTVLAILTVGVFSFSTVSAATPNTITVKRAEVLSDLITNHEYGFVIFTTSDGKILYCLDNLKKPLTSGQVANVSGNADAGILYLLQNGYPAKSITGNDEMDKYITQAAIWWYMDDTNQGDNQLSDEFRNATTTDIYGLIPDYIKPMVEKAKQAKDNQVVPSIKVNGGGELTLTEDQKYYESEFMSVALTGASSYKASVTGGTEGTSIVNENGETKDNYNANEQVKVRVPADEFTDNVNLTVNFSATGSMQRAKIYQTSDSSYQRVVGLYTEETSVTDNVKLSATPVTPPTEEKHVCEIVDDTYYGPEGTIVDKETFDRECGEEIIVPSTSANASTVAIVIGIMLVGAGAGLVIYRTRKSC